MRKTLSTRRLRIPVRLVDGTWECAWGGAIPVRGDTDAELVVQRTTISDKAFLEAMERKGRHKVLDQGTRLLVCLSMKAKSQAPESLRLLLKPYDYFRGMIAATYLDHWNAGTIVFVEVTLAGPDEKQARLFDTNRGGLWLMTEGAEAVGLASTTVLLPSSISTEPVASLNHAYTRLSEVFETWRISHTGNIYNRVLYQERNGIWYPLDDLRNKALEKEGQEIARKLWDDFMRKMSKHTPKRDGTAPT